MNEGTTATTAVSESGVVATHCARHPKVETLLRCGRCETPICPKCMVMTPVGGRCRTCARVKRVALVTKPAELLRSAAMGLGVAAVGIVIASMIPFLGLLGPAIVGFATGEVVSRGARRKRGWELGVLAVACLVLGFVVSPFVLVGLTGRVLPPALLPTVLITMVTPYMTLGLALGALLGWMRAR